MIISVTELKKLVDCGEDTNELIETKLKAIEAVVRAYTNNNFQVRDARFAGRSTGMYVYGKPQHLSVGDTVQISASGVNDGLYEITDVGSDYIQVDKFLNAVDCNLVTKISYPNDVVGCAVDLYAWKQKMSDKVGIQSETISRHHVTYFNADGSNSVMGYPASLLGCLKAYRKARF